jgi:hypothetical protein
MYNSTNISFFETVLRQILGQNNCVQFFYYFSLLSNTNFSNRICRHKSRTGILRINYPNGTQLYRCSLRCNKFSIYNILCPEIGGDFLENGVRSGNHYQRICQAISIFCFITNSSALKRELGGNCFADTFHLGGRYRACRIDKPFFAYRGELICHRLSLFTTKRHIGFTWEKFINTAC